MVNLRLCWYTANGTTQIYRCERREEIIFSVLFSRVEAKTTKTTSEKCKISSVWIGFELLLEQSTPKKRSIGKAAAKKRLGPQKCVLNYTFLVLCCAKAKRISCIEKWCERSHIYNSHAKNPSVSISFLNANLNAFVKRLCLLTL